MKSFFTRLCRRRCRHRPSVGLHAAVVFLDVSPDLLVLLLPFVRPPAAVVASVVVVVVGGVGVGQVEERGEKEKRERERCWDARFFETANFFRWGRELKKKKIKPKQLHSLGLGRLDRFVTEKKVTGVRRTANSKVDFQGREIAIYVPLRVPLERTTFNKRMKKGKKGNLDRVKVKNQSW